MRTARNVAIIAVLAIPVAFLPAGGAIADAILAALLLGFLAGIAMMVYVLYRQNQMTLSALPDSRRALLYSAVAGLALLIAAQQELLDWAGGFIIWIGLVACCAFLIFAVWREAQSL